MLAALDFAVDEEIEGAHVADAAVGEFDGETPVLGRKVRVGQFFFGDVFDEIFAAFSALENSDGNFSWFLPAHCLKMPLP